MARTALIAVGGNSLIRVGERGTIEEQLANAHQTARKITQLVADGWRVVITHGNGPQVGAALLRSERAAGEVYTQPLDVCVANTQSEIGYMLEQGLQCELRRAGFFMPVMTILTQVRVSPDDPAFTNPTKPIGPFYTQKAAEEKIRQHGWAMVEDAARGYRRVVPSPQPLEILELEVIRQILDLGIIVIALGGGGIPVLVGEDHSVTGVEGVIDKDRASSLLATGLGIDCFVISTDVDQVFVNYKQPSQRAVRQATADLMEHYLNENQFAAGSMGPKVEAAVRFVRNGGRDVFITSCDQLVEAVRGKAGTHITAALDHGQEE
ncbi:MAG: carbamate kinase [Ignavibacteriales bacterium]|nr:carbamate kinase [Ignavibacteriales bacterium]